MSGTSTSLPSASMRRAVFGRKSEQRLDRGGRLRARLELENLPEQRERDDDRRRLVVDADAPMLDEALRKHAGRDGRNDAVDERRSGAETDQRPHVRAAIDDRSARRARRTASRPRARSASQARAPSRSASAWSSRPRRWPNIASTMTTIVSGSVHQKRRWKSRELRILVVAQLRNQRLERHAALRAIAGPILPDLRMHRARVDRARSAIGGKGADGVFEGSVLVIHFRTPRSLKRPRRARRRL